MALDTVEDYVDYARTLLQDEEPTAYRYSTASIVTALNLGILEMRRLRADILSAFFRENLPSFDADELDEEVPIDPQYRTALIYYICGQVQLRDEEITQDARASIFLNKFVAQMLTIQS
jgi:GDP-D-mannose dehydratase